MVHKYRDFAVFAYCDQLECVGIVNAFRARATDCVTFVFHFLLFLSCFDVLCLYRLGTVYGGITSWCLRGDCSPLLYFNDQVVVEVDVEVINHCIAVVVAV